MNKKATKVSIAPIACKGCGREFTPKRRNKLYHDECQDRAKKRRKYAKKRKALLKQHESRCALPCTDKGTLYRHVVDGEEILLCGYHRSRILANPSRALLPKASDLWNEDAASVKAINEQMQRVNAEDANCKLTRAWNHALWVFREKRITDVGLAVRNDVLHLSIEQDGVSIGGKFRRTASGGLRQMNGYYYEDGFDAVDERLSREPLLFEWREAEDGRVYLTSPARDFYMSDEDIAVEAARIRAYLDGQQEAA